MNTQPAVEDISAIVGRFQAWAGTQAQSSPEVREISYEEARRAKRRSLPEQKAPAKKGCARRKENALLSQKEPVFKQVLTEKAAIVPAAKTTTALMPRAITLSVRITEAEQKLLRIRAAEASLTVSAYMRQCILDVDDLREQVQDLLAENRQLKERAPQFFSLKQLMQRLFCRNTTDVSVRV
jgi:hypothetical protein